MLNREDTGFQFPDDCGPWCNKIFLDSMLWSEYGAGFDLRELPAPEYDAHILLISGRRWRENQDIKKSQHKKGGVRYGL